MNEFGVYIGRFQPFTNAHEEAVRHSLSRVNNLIIVIGSASQARTIKNPWSSQERITMIRACLSPAENIRVEFIEAKDYLYNDNLWITAVQTKIEALTNGSKNVVLIGHRKDKSSFYLNLFPQWEFIETGDYADRLDASYVRRLYFEKDLLDVERFVPKPVFDVLKSSMMKDDVTPQKEFNELQEEYHHILNYRKLWETSPFPPTFVTVDAVVIKSGHILVVRRRATPGKGLFALPGGFLNQGEQVKDGAIRELKEETAIKLTKDELLTALRDKEVFDHPGRSLRGRTITHAFCFDLGHGPLPKVKGEDDADKSWWMPLRDVFANEEKFFEDHFHIINFFASKF